MIHLTLPILGEMYISDLMLLINWVVGWFIIERIRLAFKGIKTRREWNQYYNEKMNTNHDDSRQ